MTALHPYCPKCGWRKGGKDSWDGTRCKCGEMAPPMVEGAPGNVKALPVRTNPLSIRDQQGTNNG